MKNTPLIGIAAHSSQAGKTQLILSLVQELARRGLRAAVLKHASHINWPADKDSGLYMLHGAAASLIVSPTGWQLSAAPAQEPDFTLAKNLLEQSMPTDIILTEGYKNGPQPKLLISESVLDKELLLPHTIALISEAPQHLSLPCFRNTDIKEISEFIMYSCGLGGK
ncbi:MAG: molybdopterin-guanine dinucleotide biosynthesis protein MobB [Firmicutes bacterium]|nr:molybdopterin-guanine dinucleotide biosynthesis protein MobB [Bacillota bacterium]